MPWIELMLSENPMCNTFRLGFQLNESIQDTIELVESHCNLRLKFTECKFNYKLQTCANVKHRVNHNKTCLKSNEGVMFSK